MFPPIIVMPPHTSHAGTDWDHICPKCGHKWNDDDDDDTIGQAVFSIGFFLVAVFVGVGGLLTLMQWFTSSQTLVQVVANQMAFLIDLAHRIW